MFARMIRHVHALSFYLLFVNGNTKKWFKRYTVCEAKKWWYAVCKAKIHVGWYAVYRRVDKIASGQK